MDLWVNGPPGIGSILTATPKALFTQRSETFLSQGRLIYPASSRDPSNTVDVGVLQPGLPMGKITSSGLYAPASFGLSGGALTAAATSLTLPNAAVGAEIVRRIGATGSFNLIGPPVASGVVRTVSVAYSAISGTTATITAVGVNCVQTLGFTNTPSGTFQLGFVNSSGAMSWTAPITYSATIATLLSNINTALNNAFATSAIVATGTAVTAVALTFSGTGYANLPQSIGAIDVGGLSAGNVTLAMTTPGVDGRFVTSSFIAPADGSQIPLSFLPDNNAGVRVTNSAGNSLTGNVDFPQLPTSGEVDVGQMVNWPADPSLIAWLQGQLSNAQGGKFTFAGIGGYY